MIKAAFFDLDGTLISSKGTITPAVQNALSQLRKNGILVFAATGRSPYEVSTMDVFSGLEFDAIVSLNGQYCYNRQRVIHSQLFDKDDLIRITQHLQNTPFACAFVEKNDLYIHKVDDYVRTAMAEFHSQPPKIRDISDVVDRDILMLMVYLPRDLTEQCLMPLLENSDITRWNRYGVDVLPRGVSKRTGIEKILAEYDLDWDSVLAFGDGENDLEMLEKARYGVAMGNSVPELLKRDFYVTDHVDRDGVVSALTYFGLL